MDHESLRTASTYINNLLLARGLLRNAEPIDFVKPSKESRAQIINLVHDLILREDRERDQREHVAITLRDLRADQTRRIAAAAQLKERHESATRAAASAQAAERATQEELKKMDRTLKSVQDQAARLKTSLAQVKTQCVADVRKRDLELARLKTHLQGQQRGTRIATTAPSISINNGSRNRQTADPSTRVVTDPAYSLKQETTEFLTSLSQSLSDENDSLISLIRNSLATMRTLLNPVSTQGETHPDSAIGSIHSSDDKHRQELVHVLPPMPYETLADEMEAAVSQLKNVLSNPNFVNIEEVEIREEEILRLREGWEHMEQRWKDVLIMMDGWLKRINTGQSIDVEDLRRGMGLVTPLHLGRRTRARSESLTSHEPSMVQEDVSEIKLPMSDTDESSLILDPPQLLSPLGKTLAERISGKSPRPDRKVHVLDPPSSFDLRPMATSLPPVYDGSIEDVDENIPDNDEFVLTVAEKLQAAQAEAEHAAVHKVEDAPSRSAASGSQNISLLEAGERNDVVGQMPEHGARKTKIRGRARRRKSTLSPDELEQLLAQGDEEAF